MDDYEDYYFDDTAQGQEGGFGGYGDELYNDPELDPQLIAGQNTDYNYSFDDIAQGQEGGFQGYGNTFGQDMGYGTQFPDYNERTYQQMTSNPMPLPADVQGNSSFSDALTKALGGLGGLFAGKGGSSILGALAEGRQNKKYVQGVKDIVGQNQQTIDPFGSQRPYYQQQLQQSVANPYSSKIVSDQVAALKSAQDRKNAAAGRRSNSAGTDPELLRAMADIAMKYQQSLHSPAGANINPNMAGLAALLGANKQNTNGYISPLLSALGFNVGGNANSVNSGRV
mgnify:FL=1